MIKTRTFNYHSNHEDTAFSVQVANECNKSPIIFVQNARDVQDVPVPHN
jgi:hypothetical protein